jgi:hypothetical protein
MHPLIKIKKPPPLLVITFALGCLALSPAVQAVSPPPDGGYPGGNTAEGQNALFSLTTGGFNTAVGLFSLRSNTTNSLNTAIGAGALLANTADNNTATGAGALLSNTTGSVNTAYGAFALFHNTTGGGHTAVGYNALAATNASDSFEGNTAVGSSALTSDTDGNANTAIGFAALLFNTSGGSDTAIGNLALAGNTTGNLNTAIGAGALSANNADKNSATGAGALQSNTTGFQNTAIGFQALLNNTTGTGNAAMGAGALQMNTTGNANTGLGAGAGSLVTTASNVICIGIEGANVPNSCFINNIHGTTTQKNDAIPVLIDGNDQLGTASSSRRFKTDIKPMDKASESVLALEPVSFRYKLHKDTTPQFGLIAEDVAAVNPNLVIYDSDGKPYTVRYDAVNAMLLNEFLKEHKIVQEQGATITELKKQIQALTAGLQKVSAQLELNKSVPETVVNSH